MKRAVCLLMATLMVGFLVISCGTSGKIPVGAEGVPQPDWVRNVEEETNDTVYFVGEGRVQATTTARSGTARRDAQQKLAEWLDSRTTGLSTDFVKETGNTGNTKSYEEFVNEVVTAAIANGPSLHEDKTWIAADGHYVIQYSYQKQGFKDSFRKELLSRSAFFSNSAESTKLVDLLEKKLQDK